MNFILALKLICFMVAIFYTLKMLMEIWAQSMRFMAEAINKQPSKFCFNSIAVWGVVMLWTIFYSLYQL